MAVMPQSQKTIVVVGLGMVGISFIEKLLKLDVRTRQYNIIVFGEEPHVAYNRVGLTTFFEHRKVENLYLNPAEWYTSIPDNALTYHISTPVTAINPISKTITTSTGTTVPYDILVLATGSNAALPRNTPGIDARGVFVYRTVADLEALITHSQQLLPSQDQEKVGAVVGGGLLGLEAAKALLDLQTYDRVVVVERNGWVLARQLDGDAGALVVEKVRQLGVEVLLEKRVACVETDEGINVTGLRFEDGTALRCQTVVFATGIRPRDELARTAGLAVSESGGIVVDSQLRTSTRDVYAIGECASWEGQTFGLIAPGVEMADVLAWNLTQAAEHGGQERSFSQPDLSTKLKLLGVEVASFGDYFADRDGPRRLPEQRGRKKGETGTTCNNTKVKALTYRDPFQHIYKKYIFTSDGKYLLGGMMIGDTQDYVKLVPLAKNLKPLDTPPAELILGSSSKKDSDGTDDLPDDTQVCSCHNVTKGAIVSAVRDGTATTLSTLKSCTKAGTGCGGCMPLVTTIFNKTMASLGNAVSNHICAHIPRSRAELYHIVMVKQLKTFAEVMTAAGTDPQSMGCEICKPAVGSILSSLWNGHVMSRPLHGLQDTNDRFLANIQRDGSFSVVPRVPGGEITPEKLIVLGEVAREYGLYTKITGGQRIDLFGARKQDLPAIWKKLVDAGMESGHAYAKALRTVKSCVGSTWCRYGIGDSVGMAIRLEERYKSIRAPHKIKGGVSGCVRECAEAQSKDFGLIATDKGFNIYVGGNGGAKPRHAELLAKDVPPTEVIPILDRYLMFYIRTADRLQRTARWIESLPGGINYLRDVVLKDSLGLAAELESQMQDLVDSYFDEWAEAVKDPELAAKFAQFSNAKDGQDTVEREDERGQKRPAWWPKQAVTTTTTTIAVSQSDAARGEEARSSVSDSSSDSATLKSSSSSDSLSSATTVSTSPPPSSDSLEPPNQIPFSSLRTHWSSTTWMPLIPASHFDGADDLPNGISATIRVSDTQLAIFRVRGRYYATQQMCPHKRAFVLSDSLVGTNPPSEEKQEGEVYIACPHHKTPFSLPTGACLTSTGNNPNESMSIATFDVEEREDGMVYVKLPPLDELDAALGTSRWIVRRGETGAAQLEEMDQKFGGFGDGRWKRPAAVVRGRARKPELRQKKEKDEKGVEMIVEGGCGGCGGTPDW